MWGCRGPAEVLEMRMRFPGIAGRLPGERERSWRKCGSIFVTPVRSSGVTHSHPYLDSIISPYIVAIMKVIITMF
jgi:hypothetical protein